MVKLFLVLGLMCLSFSCANMGKKDLNDLNNYSFKHHQEIKEYVNSKIAQHETFTDKEKSELVKIIGKAIDKNREIKIKESKLSQMFIDAIITENPDEQIVKDIKKRLKKIYSEKEDVLYVTVSEIKKIIGVNQANHVLTLEINPFMH